MTTATGEYTSLPSQFDALSIADPLDPGAAPAISSSSSASPNGELPGEATGGRPRGGAAVGYPAPSRKAWNSPPRRGSDQDGVVFMEEPCSSWPVPSRDGASNRKKQQPQSSQKEAPSAGSPSAIPVADVSVAEVTSSSPESIPSGDPVIRSVETSSPVDPLPLKGKGDAVLEQRMPTSDLVDAAATRTGALPSKGNNNSRMSRPLLRQPTRQQQARPPMQNGHRGRNQQHFPHPNSNYGGTGNGGNHQQQRPRNHRNTKFFPHPRPTQVINDNSYNPMIGGFVMPSDWGFNPIPNLQWGPNPHISHHINTLAPPENMFLHGYLPGPYFSDGPSFSAPPLPPFARPPLVQNPPWFMPAEPILQNQHANPSMLPEHHQPPPDITQHVGEVVHMRLRKQIEYYFCNENLVKDMHLRMCMDSEGWVSVHTIADFPRVRSLTRDVGLILEVLQTSPTVEVSVDKMRRKGDWRRWTLQRHPFLDVKQEASGG